MKRGVTQLLRAAQASRGGSCSLPHRSRAQRCYHPHAGPLRQASVSSARIAKNVEIDTGADANLWSSRSQLAAGAAPLQQLHDERSGITVKVYPTTVSIQVPKEGLQDEFHFDHVWLRDICTEAESVQPDTRQKLFHTSDIHIPSREMELGLLDSEQAVKLISSESGLPTLQIAYSPRFPVVNAFSAAFLSAPEPGKDAHISNVPITTLLKHALPTLYAASHGDIGGAGRAWQASDFTSFTSSPAPVTAKEIQASSTYDTKEAFARPARLPWTALLGEEETALDARFALTDGLMRDGIAFVTGLPTDKTGNAMDANDSNSPSLARLAEMLGEIRRTFYGSLWNVRSLGASSRNIAYTNLDLGLHMDLCYFQNPPRFQFLHMLRNRVKGGASIFVDSYRVAEEMWAHHRELWWALAEVPVGFHYQNDGKHYRYTHPTFEMTPSASGHSSSTPHQESTVDAKMPRLTAVNYSPPFQSPLPLYPAMSTEKRARFYAALQLFSELTLQERFRYERTLVEGECVIFDNRRVLHSRRGFEWSQEEEGSGDGVKRWLKGCYVDGDAIWSTYRTLLARSMGGTLGPM